MRNAGDVLRTTPAILVLNIFGFFVCCRIFDFFLWYFSVVLLALATLLLAA